MRAKSNPLEGFTAKKNPDSDRSAAPVTRLSPAKGRKPAPKDEPMVPFAIRVPESFRWNFKEYALSLKKSQQDVVMEAIELHMAKHKKKA